MGTAEIRAVPGSEDTRGTRLFPITSVARDDLASTGFETSTVTDEQMAEIADHMQEAYCDDAFWVELDVIADDIGIPRKEESK